MVSKQEIEWGGSTLTLETGRLAGQASGAVLVRNGDSVVLATVVRSDRPSTLDFFPLTVQYEERMYAAGKIPGGFIRREGRPSENATLSARLTDRPLRPLFPKGYKYEIQVVVTVLSTDQQNEPDLLSIIGASASLAISDIPFAGPVGAARVGYVDGEYVLNPNAEQRAESLLDLTVAGTAEAVMMVEGSAKQLPEDVMLGAVKFAHEALQPTIEMQRKLAEEAGVAKHEYEPPAPDDDFAERIRSLLGDRLTQAVNSPDKASREDAIAALKEEVVERMAHDDPEGVENLAARGGREFEAQYKAEVRNAILTEGRRPDGRGPKDVREVSAEVGLLPRAHGSGLFTRGQTQVISVTTLGTSRQEQIIDDLGLESTKRFLHHYNFPPYSTGETKPMRGPSRRDIGHGALVERSLFQVMPPEDDFPYTVRVVSEVISSNGSSSMGSVCGSTLSLMDAGVPIIAPVSGVAMGLITGEGGSYVVLTDIQGMEDALGDMDFKVAGTEQGVTGLQMDIKTTGISYEIMSDAFEQSREGRAFILGKMLEAMPSVREELSGFAPRITTLKIDPEKIGAVIGPGGKIIRSIQDATGAQITIEDDGTVQIYSSDGPSADDARRRVEAITKDVEVGQTYNGKVVRIMPYGAFVELLPGKDGLVHISEMAEGRVERVEDVAELGDTIEVMVTDIDRNGKVSLSRKAILTGQMPAPKAPRSGGFGSSGGSRSGGGGDRGGFRSDDRPRNDAPREERPRNDRPREDRGGFRSDDRPRTDRPREERPREDRPRREPADDQPETPRSEPGGPTGFQPSGRGRMDERGLPIRNDE